METYYKPDMRKSYSGQARLIPGRLRLKISLCFPTVKYKFSSSSVAHSAVRTLNHQTFECVKFEVNTSGENSKGQLY